ncbi:MAG TPA: hypothetical protein VFA24_06910 [Gaiellaceae bacterium]|nr:hypothetical protein [Gaiellaceae bacterium]
MVGHVTSGLHPFGEQNDHELRITQLAVGRQSTSPPQGGEA